jgi:glutamate racemase
MSRNFVWRNERQLRCGCGDTEMFAIVNQDIRRSMKSTHVRLGIIDWGIGGLGLVNFIKRDAPRLSVSYFSDAGFTPYGKVPRRQLAQRVTNVVNFLVADGVTHVAIACNAASTVLPLAASDAVKISGVLEHGARAAMALPLRNSIGVVAGARTIRSGAYRRLVPNRKLQQRIAQPISAFIEAGNLDSPQLNAALDAIMAPIHSVDALVLACTHYPAIIEQWQRRAPRAVVIDPAAHMWQWMQSHWPVDAMMSARKRPDRFFTTGDVTAMRKSAKSAFAISVGKPTIVDL